MNTPFADGGDSSISDAAFPTCLAWKKTFVWTVCFCVLFFNAIKLTDDSFFATGLEGGKYHEFSPLPLSSLMAV